MRTVRYKITPPINPFNEPVPHTLGSLVEFVLAMPHLLEFGAIPPLPVFNQLLLTGLYDAGMSGGCQWKPFQIEEEEYDELVLELLTWPGKTFHQVR